MGVQSMLSGKLSSEGGSRQKASQEGPCWHCWLPRHRRGSSSAGPAPCSALCWQSLVSCRPQMEDAVYLSQLALKNAFEAERQKIDN